ncbi:hypothetical protein MFIFM68171_02262 [Madurella fahalii]|uniref:Uncharacterized protein n=1 Tax=Madurella fahalii TaxID=1157608 RepID=A0ABQ0G2R3_9PEZI
MSSLPSIKTVSLSTERGEIEYYDQVAAFSEQVINKSFEKLFRERPAVAEMKYYSGDISEGMLSAKLDAPMIVIEMDSAEHPELQFHVRFKEGHLTNGTETVDLAGWVVVVKARMEEMLASPDPNDKDSDRAKEAAKALKELKQDYDFHQPVTTDENGPNNKPRKVKAGEYSIHRLFAAISEGGWSAPLWSLSTCPGPDGKRITLSEWGKDKDNYKKRVMVTTTLSLWAETHQHSAFFTLGLQIKVPSSEDNALATYAPTTLWLQGYPYFTEEEIEEYKVPQRFPKGTPGREHNCLLYCETTNGRAKDSSGKLLPPPSFKRLPFSGNLAWRGAPGHFVIDHRLFLDQHILPLLKGLTVATQVIPLWPDMSMNDGWPQFKPRFSFASDPVDERDKQNLGGIPRGDAANPFFLLKPDGPARYKWSDTLHAPGSRSYVAEYPGAKNAPFYRKYVIFSEMSVTLAWTPGDHRFRVEGRTLYDHWEAYFSNRDFPWERADPDVNLWGAGECSFKVEATWSFTIDLLVPPASSSDAKTPNGVIKPKVLGIDSTGLPKDFRVNGKRPEYFLDDTPTKVTTAIRDNISDAVKKITEGLEGKFDYSGRFTYPGTSELEFGDPKINQWGDIYATINYMDRPGRVQVRPPGYMKYEVPAERKPGVVVTNPLLRGNVNPPHVSWQVGVPAFDPNTKRVKISLTGSNITGENVGFSRVKVVVPAIKDLNFSALFAERDPKKWVKKEEPKPQPLKPKPKPGQSEPGQSTPGQSTPGQSAPGQSKPGQPPKSEPAGEPAPSGGKTGTDDNTTGTESSKDSPVNTPKSDETSGDTEGNTTAKGGSSGEGQPAPDAQPVPRKTKRPIIPTQPSTKPNESTDTTEPNPPPPPQQTWHMQSKNVIGRNLDVSARIEAGNLVFDVMGHNAKGRPEKFILDSSSQFTLELEGTVPMVGTYVLQLNEVWASPDPDDDTPWSDKWADTFIGVELNATGGGKSYSVGVDTYEKLLGVQPKPDAPAGGGGGGK